MTGITGTGLEMEARGTGVGRGIGRDRERGTDTEDRDPEAGTGVGKGTERQSDPGAEKGGDRDLVTEVRGQLPAGLWAEIGTAATAKTIREKVAQPGATQQVMSKQKGKVLLPNP